MSGWLLSLGYPVSANKYWRMVRTPSRTLMLVSREAQDYKADVSARCRVAGLRAPLVGAVELWVELHPRTNADGAASARVIDLDNCLKVTLDSLQGNAYVRDSQVRRLHAAYGQPLPDGGLTVRIEPMHTQD